MFVGKGHRRGAAIAISFEHIDWFLITWEPQTGDSDGHLTTVPRNYPLATYKSPSSVLVGFPFFFRKNPIKRKLCDSLSQQEKMQRHVARGLAAVPGQEMKMGGDGRALPAILFNQLLIVDNTILS